MNFDKEKYREYMKEKQYCLNARDELTALRYGTTLTFNEIIELRLCALRETLIKYNVEVITDIPFGKGLSEYRNKWEQLMIETINTRKKCK